VLRIVLALTSVASSTIGASTVSEILSTAIITSDGTGPKPTPEHHGRLGEELLHEAKTARHPRNQLPSLQPLPLGQVEREQADDGGVVRRELRVKAMHPRTKRRTSVVANRTTLSPPTSATSSTTTRE